MARGSLTKTATGWRGQVYLGKKPDGGDIRPSKSFHVKDGFDHTIAGRRRAEAAMDKWRGGLRSWDYNGSTVTFGDLYGMFIAAEVEGGNANTVEVYRWSEQHVAGSELNAKPINEITVRDLEWLLLRLADKQDLSVSSLNTIRHHWRRMFKWSMRDDWIVKNPAEFVELPRNVKKTRARTAMTVDQAQQLLAAARGHRMYTPLLVGMTRALRPGELFGLQWADLDIDTASPILRVTGALKHHKGHLSIGTLKQNYRTDQVRSRRDLTLSPELAATLRTHRDQQHTEQARAGKRWDTTHNNVFATKLGTLVNPANFRRDCRKLLAAANVHKNGGDGPNFVPYEILRHTGLSILSAIGLPDAALIDLAGHADETMLHNVYRHQIRESVDAGVDAITDLLTGEPQT